MTTVTTRKPAADTTVPPQRKARRASGLDDAGSLHEEVLARLRDYIVEGPLEPGSRIPERELCEQFGVSRTPLREALKVLAAEGLVELFPNKSARVRALSEHDIQELFDVIGGLEALAGRLACENATDAEILEIEHLHQKMYGFYIRREMSGYFEHNIKIHEKIVEAAHNATLAAVYTGLSGRVRRIRYSANLTKSWDRWGEAMREHELILDALRRRAGGELSGILFNHLRNKRKAAIDQLADGDADEEAP